METVKVVLLGFGTVGSGVYDSILHTHQEKLEKVIGKKVEIVGILVKTEKDRQLPENIIVTTKIEEILALPKIDYVFEAIVGIEPAYSYTQLFLDRGCHVISANKELLANRGEELSEYALNKGKFLTFEAAVAGGIPLLRTIIQLLQVNGILVLEGILNGTSNYILSKMRNEKLSFGECLQEAQQLGYAEANPESDISGRDAFYKQMILSSLIYHEQPDWEKVERVGIEDVALEDLALGEGHGLRLKLLASLKRGDEGIQATVKPTFVSSEHPLYNVEGVDNGIVIKTDLVGTLMLQGPGAGSKATASAMIEDLVQIEQQKQPLQQVHRYSYQTQTQNKKEANESIQLAVFPLQDKEEWLSLKAILNENSKSVNILQEVVKELDGRIYGSFLYDGELECIKLPVLYKRYPVSPIGLKRDHFNLVNIF
ncbi:homoserine dehydrogenase [Robertmurraya korlensis]|uniref:homoserine dehydrogenase n=1 Tax=Robertmurraya korlensis TaxID=519977 RepID=UPI00203E1B6B|nr:homoserine dehydrogenase [Robertmurraya korlensis]MCM3602480.1 homoserine dehydrogenase [Robertmurraya korlensis]